MKCQCSARWYNTAVREFSEENAEGEKKSIVLCFASKVSSTVVLVLTL